VLALKLGCSPTAAQVAAETGLTEEQVQEAMELGSAYHPMNILEETVSAEGDMAGQPPSVGMEGANQDLFWDHILSFLSENEAAVIRLRFWDGLPQREVAVHLGTSQMNVSRIQRNALAKLRKVMRHSGLPDE
jgi:RNA polymerase sigma-B factor